MKTINLIIVEDIPFQRRELVRTFDGVVAGDLEFSVLLAEADGREALEALDEIDDTSTPDILLADFVLDSRDHDGAWFAERCRERFPEIGVCFVTDQYRDIENLKAMLAIPECSIIAKSDDFLLKRIQEIAAGRRYTSPAVVREFERHISSDPLVAPRLSESELLLVYCQAVGFKDQVTASVLGVKTPTVRGYINRLSAKLSCPPKGIASAAWECGALTKRGLDEFREKHKEMIERLE